MGRDSASEDAFLTPPVADLIALIDEAHRAGLDRARTIRLRRRLDGPVPGQASVLRLERALRHWLAAHDALGVV